MPLQMIVSTILPGLVKLSQCSRRKQKSPSVSLDDALDQQKGLKYANELAEDADDTGKSTEAGDFSQNDLSDLSERLAGSSDGSDAETSAMDFRGKYDAMDVDAGRLRMPFRPPPGLEAPPGLVLPPGIGQSCFGGMGVPNVQDGTFLGHMGHDTHSNSQANMFFPSCVDAEQEQCYRPSNARQLRESIRLLKESLEEWEANSFPAVPAPANAAEVNTLLALQDALSRLTPDDSAMVRAFLDSRAEAPVHVAAAPRAHFAQPTPTSGLGIPAVHAGNSRQPSHAGGTQIPFAPPGRFDGAHPCSRPIVSRATAKPFGIVREQSHLTPMSGVGRNQPQNQHARRPAEFQHRAAAKPEKSIPDDSSESLSSHLAKLATLDNGRVLMVRKINRLGMESAAALQSYFSKFGAVDRVLTSNCQIKTTAGKNARVRPATVGFVVMDAASSVQAALAHGADHLVQGVSISVSSFQSHRID